MNPLHAADQARRMWPPEAGYFRLKLTKKGWPVPCRIFCEWDGRWHAVVDGRMFHADCDPALAPWIGEVWTRAEKISKADYDWLMAVKSWATEHHPDHPCLHPRNP